MNSNTLRVAATAALFVVTGTSALAESRLKATVPFGFTTPARGYVPAGEVIVAPSSHAAGVYTVRNVTANKTVVVVTSSALSRSKRSATAYPAQLAFSCVAGRCALSGIFPQGEFTGRAVTVPRRPASAPATQISQILIPLTAE